MSWVLLPALLSLAIWCVLLFARGGFWRLNERLGHPPEPAAAPAVVAVVPARNEAAVVGRAVASLLAQDYAGDVRLVLVDDHSDDGTVEAAMAAAGEAGEGGAARLTIVRAEPLPAGWAGKLWAQHQGLRAAREVAPEAAWVWLTDADIAHPPDLLRRLVAKGEAEDRDLVSLMVRLRCRTPWERLLIPPFVYFFAKLFPFAWIDENRHGISGAAGGCMLVRRLALDNAGGLAPIRAALIDDCSLARRIRRYGRPGGAGRLWLGHGPDSVSLRGYDALAGIWAMVRRSAYEQLRRSPALLLGTVLGMLLTYLAPPLLVLTAGWHENAAAAALGLLAWAAMSVSLLPALALYGRSRLWAPLLPAAALLYTAMTLDSALAHRRGRGGAWKGRNQAAAAEVRTVTAAAGGLETPSGKGSGDENFPVGSLLIERRLRPTVLAYYAVARATDDVADNPALAPADKIARLTRFQAALEGRLEAPEVATAVRARRALRAAGVPVEHAWRLQEAFKRDAVKGRYDDWDDLMGYCADSANPVGRFLLDLHHEDRAGFVASDALCSALQVINHLQDCQKDYRELDRVYLPGDWLAAEAVSVEDLDAPRASPGLRRVLDRCLAGVDRLLAEAAPLPWRLRSTRLAMESAAILRLAEVLSRELRARDPLAERVVLSKPAMAWHGGSAALACLLRRTLGARPDVARLDAGRGAA